MPVECCAGDPELVAQIGDDRSFLAHRGGQRGAASPVEGGGLGIAIARN
jgi:hypothetical protein